MMKYYKIEWIHNWNKEYPFCYFIEVGDNFYETKKIEQYKDGRMYYADETMECGTFLSPEPITDINDFNSKDDDEIMKGVEISKNVFFNEWRKLTKEKK